MSAAETRSEPRFVRDRLQGRGERILKSWESLLFVVAVLIFIVNVWSSPYFLDPWNLSDATYNFTEKGLIAFALALVIISGEIDLSVASILALSSTLMGLAMSHGAGVPELVLIGLGTGLVCGAINGVLVSHLGLPSIVVTIGTMSLFRGVAYIILGDKAFTGYPADFAWFGQGYVWWVFSVELLLFVIAAIVFAVLLHATSFGRMVYVIGNNAVAAQFSGVRVERVKFILFLLSGLMSGVAAICLTSRLGSTRPSIATGWELEAVTMAVLGGINILGGSGRIGGVVLAALIMGMVTFGFGLLNVPGIVMSIFVGLLLILVIAIPKVLKKLAPQKKRA